MVILARLFCVAELAVCAASEPRPEIPSVVEGSRILPLTTKFCSEAGLQE